MRHVWCRDAQSNIRLPDNRCSPPKPLTMERCIDLGPCFLDPKWVPGEWSQVYIPHVFKQR